MRNTISKSLLRTLTLTLTAALVPLAVSAQQQDQPTQPTDQPAQPIDQPASAQQQTPQCTMQSEAIEVAIGQAAAEVSIEISEQFGAVSEIEPAMGSSLALASAEDIPRTDLAADDEEPQPVQMSSEGSSATVWLNTEDVEEGSYQLTLHGDRGTCTAEVSVTPEN